MDYIKLSRKILDWEWYLDINTCRLFIHLLLKANWKEGRFQGAEIPRGSLATSYGSLAKDTGLSVKNVRTALKHLEATGEVAVKRHAKFSVITVKNYNVYQTDGTVNGSQAAVKRQASGSQVATIEERKKGRKEDNNIYIAPDDKSPCAGKFLLNDATEYEVSENDVVRYQQLYPGIDVKQELRGMEAWCLSNPKNRKTRNGAKRFMNAWLARAQNSAQTQNGTRTKPAGFHDFPQRDYDFADLEAKLIEN